MQNSVLPMIGLAAKAGKVASGEFSVEKAVKTRKAFLVIISEDASDNTVKKFTNMTNYYEVTCYRFGSREELGRYTGKNFRVLLAITDENLAKAIENRLIAYKTE